MQDSKFICPKDGFETTVAGYCPMCDENYLKKVCECGSGDYASTCCEPDLEQKEKEMEQALIKDVSKELATETEKEIDSELKKEAEEEKFFETDEDEA